MESITNFSLCAILWEDKCVTRAAKIEALNNFVKLKKGAILSIKETEKITNFYKMFQKKMLTSNNGVDKFKTKYIDWLNLKIFKKNSEAGAPKKAYDDLGPKSKKSRKLDTLSKHSEAEVCDTYKELLKQKKQPATAIRIADVLPEASPKRLLRIANNISTPQSTSDVTEEEAMALQLVLGISKNGYNFLRKFFREKGFTGLPSYEDILNRKKEILPSPVEATEEKASINLSSLLENTASRIFSTFSEDELKKANNKDVLFILKWGCDGLSALPEYKQACRSGSSTNYKSVFMSSLVPLRMQTDSTAPSNSSSVSVREDIWTNTTPGSKIFCRPIRFEFVKETKETTNALVKGIKNEIDNLDKITFQINNYNINVSFQLLLTMIDGKVSNAITDTVSNAECSFCGDKQADFSNISKERVIKKEAASYGISPLHARIRFLEFFLHISYDIKYRLKYGKEPKVRNNKELHSMRESEKQKFQEEFKLLMGLNIDKPLVGHGSTNDGNTARRFFEHYTTTSNITGLDKDLLLRVNVILMAINSTSKVNSTKFGAYAYETMRRIISLYGWRPLTPTVHKVLCHGQFIMENNILPLGELTEEAQEARNRDFKNIQFFHTRKCSRLLQNKDLFNNLLLSSDPAISSIRHKWLMSNPSRCEDEEVLKDFNYLLDLNDVHECFVKIE